MNNAEFQLRGVGDPRLAVHATSPQPVWLWSTDGTRILWANPVGARLFGAANGAVLAQKIFGPADMHRRQMALLANRLPLNGASRLERLRGFGAALGALSTCSCARLEFSDGSHFSDGSYGILVVSAEPVGRAMPLIERLQSLVEGIDTPIAAYTSDGMFISASDAARALLGFRNLTEAGLEDARNDALKQGRVETPVGIGRMVLQRVGSGANVGLVALIASGASLSALPQPAAVIEDALPETRHAPTALADDEQPAATSVESGISEKSDISGQDQKFATEAPSAETLPLETAPLDTPSPETPTLETMAEPVIETPVAATQIAQHEPSAEVEASREIETSTEIETLADEPTASSDEATCARETSTQETSTQETSTQETSTQETSTQETSGEEQHPAAETHRSAASAIQPAAAPSWLDEPLPNVRRKPLRFMWQMDAEGRFSLGSDEFTRLIGTRTAAGFGRLWSEIAETFDLDPEGRVLKAVRTRDTWSGITLNWPVDGGGRLRVELSGLPIYDRAREFIGYRGFGVCRDPDGLARLAALRRYEFLTTPPKPKSLSADIVPPTSAPEAMAAAPSAADVRSADSPATPSDSPTPETFAAETFAPQTISPETLSSDTLAPDTLAPTDSATSHPTHLETSVETPKNVLPFRPLGEPKLPALTPIENNAFNELARQLSARLDNKTEAPSEGTLEATGTMVDLPLDPQTPAAPEQPEWLARPETPARGESQRDKLLLDLLPVGILIYRLDRLLYANRSFLERMGYESLGALEQAGGLDALYVEPGVSTASSTSGTGTPVTISPNPASAQPASSSATDAHLFTINWDDDSALALIFAGAQSQPAAIAAAIGEPLVAPASSEPDRVSADAVGRVSADAVGRVSAEELGAVLDTTAAGVVMFDAQGKINYCNRSAEALFGYDGSELVQRNLVELFALESQPAVMDYLQSTRGADLASLLDHGRDLLGRVRGGGVIPLSMTMGRTQPEGPRFFAVFRDLSQTRKSETELQQARRTADRASNAKADMLARISHEVRTPLNAIIGFADVMIGERFGPLGNERYVEYMKDIRASGERVLAIINDLLDLSRIETGKMDLAFVDQNLNDLVESCVAVMQPQANRERIIIRTSLAHMLPPVVADARALRQITLNLIGNSIHLANAGGQVIVSTALSDFGEVVLRVRDTGHGLNDNEVAAAMEPFGAQAPNDQASESSGVSLSLTKALVEANRAKFQIKTGPRSGTLIEVLFSRATAKV